MAVFSLGEHSENLELNQMPRTGKNRKFYLKEEAERFLKPQKKTVKVKSDNGVFIYVVACQGGERTEVLCCTKRQNKQVRVSRRLVSRGYVVAV